MSDRDPIALDNARQSDFYREHARDDADPRDDEPECMHLDAEPELEPDTDGCTVCRCRACGDRWNSQEVFDAETVARERDDEPEGRVIQLGGISDEPVRPLGWEPDPDGPEAA